MSLRAWALKPSEVKALSRAGLVLLAGRCARRVEPWCPREARADWRRALSLVTASAKGRPPDRDAALRLARRLGDAGARACNARDGTPDELLGRGMNYATGTLALALEAAVEPERATVLRLVLDAAKQSTAFAALHAHAGRVRAPAGTDAVTVACVRVWDEVRRDVAVLVAGEAAALQRAAPIDALRGLWTGRPPPWATPRGRVEVASATAPARRRTR